LFGTLSEQLIITRLSPTVKREKSRQFAESSSHAPDWHRPRLRILARRLPLCRQFAVEVALDDANIAADERSECNSHLALTI